MNEISIPYEIFKTAEELPQDEKDLLEKAVTALEGAYAPYSGFLVGCALGLTDGSVITGNNQENKAYPSGICAERTALFYAGGIGKGKQIRKIAIRAKGRKIPVTIPVAPCGACRQVMLEYEVLGGEPFIILLQGESGPVMRLKGVKDSLLPFAFDAEF